MTSAYVFDPQWRIWLRPAAAHGLEYTDGEVIEERLLTAVRECSDIRCISTELRGHISDWPSEYHFSPARGNLLRFMVFRPEDRVLELGCGCGALTRFLGETGAAVTAVEGSSRRATIAAERCRDLKNVRIYGDNLVDFETDDRFDHVLLIGVLEYAPRFVGSEDPVLAVLRKARSFLKEDGRLILAIENQLGLKYFSGCNEDHTGIPFFGINGLYQSGGPVTFGRHILSEKLREAGLRYLQFFFPFPDYKLPGLILSETALTNDRLNIADLLLSNAGRNYPEDYQRTFAEDLAWRTVIGNGLLPELSNSLLVLAAPDSAESFPTPRWLAKLYSTGKRQACYQVETTIRPGDGSQLVVSKRRINAGEAVVDGALDHVVRDSPYYDGMLLTGRIRTAMAREATIEDIACCFAPWLRFLLANSRSTGNGAAVLPGHFVDCIPSNIIVSPSGEVYYFDPEWVRNTPIPVAWVAIRGIVYALIGCLENRNLRQMTYRQFISEVAGRNGLRIDAEDFSIGDALEAGMVSQCQIDAASTPRLVDFLDTPLFLVLRMSGNVRELHRALDWHQAELDRIKHTVSWRITAPLRVFWNLLLGLTGKASR